VQPVPFPTANYWVILTMPASLLAALLCNCCANIKVPVFSQFPYIKLIQQEKNSSC